MKYLRLGLFPAVLILIVAAGLDCARPSASNPDPHGYEILGADFEPLRSNFNAKTDHVRAVLLVGPT